MKAYIEIDVPEFQIGQTVNIFFKDTMMVKGQVKKLVSSDCTVGKCSMAVQEVGDTGEPKFLCPIGAIDCVLDPMYTKRTDPEWYKELYGDKTPQEVVQETCMKYINDARGKWCRHYDDEDK